MSVRIHLGDKLALPLKIKNGQSYITPADVDDVRIQVGDTLRSYSNDEIEYADQVWYYPISEKESRRYSNVATSAQVGIKIGEVITYSDVQQIEVQRSIIVKEW